MNLFALSAFDVQHLWVFDHYIWVLHDGTHVFVLALILVTRASRLEDAPSKLLSSTDRGRRAGSSSRRDEAVAARAALRPWKNQFR